MLAVYISVVVAFRSEEISDSITIFQCLKGGYEGDGDSLFTRSYVFTRDDGHKLLLGR